MAGIQDDAHWYAVPIFTCAFLIKVWKQWPREVNAHSLQTADSGVSLLSSLIRVKENQTAEYVWTSVEDWDFPPFISQLPF